MEVGVLVWAKNPDKDDDEYEWFPGEVLKKYPYIGTSFQYDVKVRGRSHEIITFTSDTDGSVPTLMMRNDEDESAEDLIKLTHLHEPAILHALVERFDRSLIYTYTGPILIAVNPFQYLDLYTDDILEAYYEGGIVRAQGFESLPMEPHVYAIAANAYQDMVQRLERGRGPRGTSEKIVPRSTALRDKQAPSQMPTSSSQSILISGESGSGKTVSTKHCLEYLTTVGEAARDRSTGLKAAAMNRDIDSNKVVQSNPILEAFGNAKTVRNDNSSRFGKLVQMYFGRKSELLGGNISAYLLEKVRLPTHNKGERNFHIFYQLCADSVSGAKGAGRRASAMAGGSRRKSAMGSSPGKKDVEEPVAENLHWDAERAQWALKGAKEYAYTNQGGGVALRDVDDKAELGAVRHAMSVLKFEQEETADVLAIAASLLHLGEMTFREDDGYGSLVADEEAAEEARAFCGLTGLDYEQLVKSVTSRDVSTKWDTVVKKLRPVDAQDTRDALAKALYSRLFDWLVLKVNESLEVDDEFTVQASVNVLDIFGFECFEENSLEQLCINYTNEKLQQHFNTFIFKLEEAEYTREGIEYSFVDFPDNQDCLDLIEGRKPPGILAVLDDECNNPNGNDKNFVSRIFKAFLGDEASSSGGAARRRATTIGADAMRMRQSFSFDATSAGMSFLGDVSGGAAESHGKHARFSSTSLMKPRGQFVINHYAGPVTYTSAGFWVKNRDELVTEVQVLLQSSAKGLVAELFSTEFEHQSSAKASFGAAPSPMKFAKTLSSPAKASSGGKTEALKTVANKFKSQLADLMERLSATQPHYIRCLKPNDAAEPAYFCQRRVGQQLRYGGVLEAVRVSRSGFPVRMTHADFFFRYRKLVMSAAPASDLPPGAKAPTPLPLTVSSELRHAAEAEKHTRTLTERLASAAVERPVEKYDRDTLQFGLTKVFLRKKSHDALEARLVTRRTAAATSLQASQRSARAAASYRALRRAGRLLQRRARGAAARRRVAALRRLKAAGLLQRQARRLAAAALLRRAKHAAVALQARQRGGQARSAAAAHKRRWLAARMVQCFGRCRLAARARKRLAVEARDIKAIKAKQEAILRRLEEEKAAEAAAAAKAAAEETRQADIDRSLKRTLHRLYHSLPLSLAWTAWTAATKVAKAKAAEAARLESALARQKGELEAAGKKQRGAAGALSLLRKASGKGMAKAWGQLRLAAVANAKAAAAHAEKLAAQERQAEELAAKASEAAAAFEVTISSLRADLASEQEGRAADSRAAAETAAETAASAASQAAAAALVAKQAESAAAEKVQAAEDARAKEQAAAAEAIAEAEACLQAASLATDVLKAQVASLEETLKTERSERESERENEEKAAASAAAREQHLKDEVAKLGAELGASGAALEAANAVAREAASSSAAALSGVQAQLREEVAGRAEDCARAARAAAALEAAVADGEAARGKLTDAAAEEGARAARASEAARAAVSVLEQQLAEVTALAAAREAESFERLETHAAATSALEVGLAAERAARKADGDAAKAAAEEAKQAAVGRTLRRVVQRLSRTGPLGLAWQAWGTRTRAAAAAVAAAAAEHAAERAGEALASVEARLTAEQKGRLADARSAAEASEAARAREAALEQGLAEGRAALASAEAAAARDEEALRTEVEAVRASLEAEQGAREADNKVHADKVAGLEVRAKTLTDGLRAQLEGLMETAANERKVRQVERAKLDAKSKTAASRVDELAAQITRLEDELSVSNAEKAEVAMAAQSLSSALESSVATLESSLAAEREGRFDDSARAHAEATAVKDAVKLKALKRMDRMHTLVPQGRAWDAWTRHTHKAVEHAARAAAEAAVADGSAHVAVLLEHARAERAEASARAANEAASRDQAAKERVLRRIGGRLGRSGPLRWALATWVAGTRALAEDARCAESESDRANLASAICTLKEGLRTERESCRRAEAKALLAGAEASDALAIAEAARLEEAKGRAAAEAKARQQAEALRGEAARLDAALADASELRAAEAFRARETVAALKAKAAGLEELLAVERAAVADAGLRGLSASLATDVLKAQVASLEETLETERSERESEREGEAGVVGALREFEAKRSAEVARLKEALAGERSAWEAKVGSLEAAAADLGAGKREAEEAAREATQAADGGAAAARAAAEGLTAELAARENELAAERTARVASAAEACAAVEGLARAEALLAEEQALASAEAAALRAAGQDSAAKASALEQSWRAEQDARRGEAAVAKAAAEEAKQAAVGRTLRRVVQRLSRTGPLGLAWQAWGARARAAAAAAAAAAAEHAAERAGEALASVEARLSREAASAAQAASVGAAAEEHLRELLEEASSELAAARGRLEASGGRLAQLEAQRRDEVEGLEESLGRERSGRAADAKATAEAIAGVEARAKAVTDELRAQVSGLVEATGKERQVRTSQRTALDARAQGAVAAADVLRAKVAALEGTLGAEREERQSDALRFSVASEAAAAELASISEALAAEQRARRDGDAAAGAAAAKLEAAAAASAAEARAARAEVAASEERHAALEARLAPVQDQLRSDAESERKKAEKATHSAGQAESRAAIQCEALREHVASLVAAAARDRADREAEQASHAERLASCAAEASAMRLAAGELEAALAAERAKSAAAEAAGGGGGAGAAGGSSMSLTRSAAEAFEGVLAKQAALGREASEAEAKAAVARALGAQAEELAAVRAESSAQAQRADDALARVTEAEARAADAEARVANAEAKADAAAKATAKGAARAAARAASSAQAAAATHAAQVAALQQHVASLTEELAEARHRSAVEAKRAAHWPRPEPGAAAPRGAMKAVVVKESPAAKASAVKESPAAAQQPESSALEKTPGRAVRSVPLRLGLVSTARSRPGDREPVVETKPPAATFAGFSGASTEAVVVASLKKPSASNGNSGSSSSSSSSSSSGSSSDGGFGGSEGKGEGEGAGSSVAGEAGQAMVLEMELSKERGKVAVLEARLRDLEGAAAATAAMATETATTAAKKESAKAVNAAGTAAASASAGSAVVSSGRALADMGRAELEAAAAEALAEGEASAVALAAASALVEQLRRRAAKRAYSLNSSLAAPAPAEGKGEGEGSPPVEAAAFPAGLTTPQQSPPPQSDARASASTSSSSVSSRGGLLFRAVSSPAERLRREVAELEASIEASMACAEEFSAKVAALEVSLVTRAGGGGSDKETLLLTAEAESSPSSSPHKERLLAAQVSALQGAFAGERKARAAERAAEEKCVWSL